MVVTFLPILQNFDIHSTLTVFAVFTLNCSRTTVLLSSLGLIPRTLKYSACVYKKGSQT